MIKHPLISVIMPVYNEPISDLKDSINSILNQTYKNFEYIIIDDNPSNNLIKRYIMHRSSDNNKIKLIFNSHNLKLAKSENKGIKLSKGAYIARMDADDIADKSRLYMQLKFTVHNDLDFSSSNFSLINNNGDLTRRFTYSKHNVVNQKKIRNIMKRRNVAIGPAFFFRKSLFNSIHGYRNMNSEDYDFVARALIHGFKVGYQAHPLLLKRLLKAGISFGTLYNQYIIVFTISKYLNKYNYSKIMPLNILKYKLDNINEKELKHFNRYTNARYYFNDYKTITNLLKVFMTIFSSKVVFKRCLWSLYNKFEDKFM